MRLTDVAKKYDIPVADLKTMLESLGVPEEGRTNLSSIPEDTVIEIRKLISGKRQEKVEENETHVTTLPSGKKVILLFSPIKSLTIALKQGVNISFDNHQLVIDTEDKGEMALYNTIMRIGPADAFVVLQKPYPEHSSAREEFERKLQNWLVETGFGASGEPSPKGSARIQALFHRDEQAVVYEKRGEVTARTLKMTAVNEKSLIPAKL